MNQLKVFCTALMLPILAIGAQRLAQAESRTATVKGYVLDSACAFTKNLKKPISVDCALACAKSGSPLVILADDGMIYWPISGTTPATGQNERLIEFAGHRVSATGRLFQKGGSRAMVIEKIEAAPSGK
jgi:hypothetical protein